MTSLFARHGLLTILLAASTGHAENSIELNTSELLSLDIADLFAVKIISASGIVEELRQAPATVVVITADDIARRGYDNLIEVLADVPGFDLAISNGDFYANAYQRGYRTPFTQRTLFLIDGVVANELWSQSFDLSRQYPLQAIERIEILYGPASAVYGANAFSGVVQLFSKGAGKADAQGQGGWRLRSGSYNTRSIDGDYSQAFGALKWRADVRYFDSDEPGLDDLHGFTGFSESAWLNNRDVWGPILGIRDNGRHFGEYRDPSKMWSLLVNSEYKDWQTSVYGWRSSEGYGVHYPGDRAQPNAAWDREAGHIYVQHKDELSAQAKLTTRVSARASRWWSDWAEATPDWHDDRQNFSYVSYSHWRTDNEATQLEQQLELALNQQFQWLFGWKYQRQSLTRAYAVCGYWEPQSYCPQDPDIADPGPAAYGPWVVPSDAIALASAPQPDDMSSDNIAKVSDWGAYMQGVYDIAKVRLNLGLRYDHHSIYGASVSPRTAVIYNPSAQMTMKLIYGEAWQEPASIQVYGGWNGRAANEQLQPEEARNREFVFMYQQVNWLHEVSLYHADYAHAIRESADNAAGRHIQGLEYRSHFEWNSEWLHDKIQGYLYYTYADAKDEQHYVAATDISPGMWVDGTADIGDIARHKVQLGLTLPLSHNWNWQWRNRYVGERDLYGSNPLRAHGETLGGYVVCDWYWEYHSKALFAGITVSNVFDRHYQDPGVGLADAGTDASQRSLGWSNSVLAQPGRSLFLTLGSRF